VYPSGYRVSVTGARVVSRRDATLLKLEAILPAATTTGRGRRRHTPPPIVSLTVRPTPTSHAG
jgi:hypothetical protein